MTDDDYAALDRIDRSLHHGWHTCVDGRTYDSDCLVTDPAMRDVAAFHLARRRKGKS